MSFLLQNILYGLAYFFVSYVFLSVAMFDNALLPLWPSAGIALAAFLLCGNRVLLGVACGMLAANSLVSYMHIQGPDVFDISSIVQIFVRSFGTILQAYVGAWLIKRYQVFDYTLEDSKSIAMLYGLGGLASSFIGATIATLSFHYEGVILSDELWSSFANLWAGYAFGVILLCPVVLVLSQSSSLVVLNRKLNVGTVCITGLSLLFLLHNYVLSNEQENQIDDLRQRGHDVIAEIVEEMIEMDNIHYALNSFYLSSDMVTRREFSSFIAPYISLNPHITGIAWAPYVDDTNVLDSIEPFLRDDPEIREKFIGLDDVLRERSYLFPVLFVEPYDKVKSAIAYDVSSVDSRQLTIIEAIERNMAVLSEPLRLFTQDEQDEFSFLHIAPIFEDRIPLNSYGHLSGVSVIAFSGPGFFSTFADELYEKELTMRVIETASEQTLFESEEWNDRIKPHEHFAQNYSFGRKQWLFEFRNMDQKSHVAETFVTILSANTVMAFVTFIMIVMTGQASATERTVTQRTKDLEASQQRMQLAIEGVQDGVWDWDVQTGACFYSDNFKKMVVYHDKDFPSEISSWLSLLPESEKKLVGRMLEEHRVTKAPYFVEYRLRCGDGVIRWFEAKANSVWDDNGNQMRMVGSIRDISERKAMERNLLIEKEYSDYIVRRNPALVVGLDPEWQIIFVNQKVCDLTGYNELDLLNKNWWAQFFLDRDGVQVEEALEILKKHGEIVDHEMVIISKTGEKLTISWSSQNKYNDEGELEQILLFGVDLTELLKYQDELLRAKEEADRANDVKSGFLANMSHEIRTPMNGIIGTVSLLNGTKTTDKQKDYLGVIHDSAHSLLKIINEILDYSKIESGKFEINPNDVFDVSEIAQSQFNLLKPLADEKGLYFRVNIRQGVPKLVKGDETRFRQILMNFISNALKFTLSGGISIEISCDKSNPFFLEFVVEDTGMGIPKDKQKEIFDAFSQVDEFQTKNTQGTGLGLSISKYLIEAMGGSIELYSELNTGTNFTFTIQFEDPAGEEIEADDEVLNIEEEAFDISALNLGKKVLLAEDVLTNQFVLTDMLETAGCIVDVAENGLIAVEKVQQGDYDLVFMDCQMPEMDGFEATRAIRELGYEDLKIVALTANALKGDKDKCLAAGMDDFVSKPVEKEDLIRNLIKNLKINIL